MPEHVHLLLHLRDINQDMSAFLTSVKESVTRKALGYRRSSEKPDSVWTSFYDMQPSGKVHFRFWQRGGGYDRDIWSVVEATEKLCYIHENPVRRGLCAVAEQWPWSSAAFYAGAESGPVRVERAEL